MPQEPPRWMRFPIEFLVLACLVVGILPTLTIGPILDIAVRSVLGPQVPQYSLSVWHGLTVPLMMSMVALGGGAVLYLLLQPHLARGKDGAPLLPSGAGPPCLRQRPGCGVLAMGQGDRASHWHSTPATPARPVAACRPCRWPLAGVGARSALRSAAAYAGGYALSADVDRRRGMRCGGRLAGQVPPTGGAHARLAARGWWSASHSCGSPRRTWHSRSSWWRSSPHPVAAGAALAAATQTSTQKCCLHPGGAAAACARPCPGDRRGLRPGPHRLRCHDTAAA